MGTPHPAGSPQALWALLGPCICPCTPCRTHPNVHRHPQPSCHLCLWAGLGLRGGSMSRQPANILLDEFGHVRISDLGLACDFSKKKPHASV